MTSKSILWVPLITQTIYNLPMPSYLFCNFRLRAVQCTVWCGSRDTSLHEANEPRRMFDFEWLIGGLRSQIVVLLSGPCGFPQYRLKPFWFMISLCLIAVQSV